MELHDVHTSFIRHDKNEEIGEPSPESTSSSLDSMEAGTSRYWFSNFFLIKKKKNNMKQLGMSIYIENPTCHIYILTLNHM